MKKSKYRIYTIVPPKKTMIFVLIIAILFFVIWGLPAMPHPKSKMFDRILKKSIGSVFMAKTTEPIFDFGKSKIKIHSLMNQVSPVFANAKNSVAVYNNKENDTTTVKAEEKVQKVNAKTIETKKGSIKNETDYDIDVKAMTNLPRTYCAIASEPKVLVIHTHGCETYSDNNGNALGENGEYRTTDEQKNMIKIGEVITEVFKEKGINVIHDKTLCDYPKYNSSYVKSLEIIEKYLKKYPSIEFVFDIHRDAIAESDGTATKLVCNIKGKDTAQVMIVCGTDSMGLENPNWQENLILALKIQKNIEDKYPGLMRPVNIRKERFNMHKTKGSLLFEVGSHGNTLEEAILGAKYLAEGIAETIG